VLIVFIAAINLRGACAVAFHLCGRYANADNDGRTTWKAWDDNKTPHSHLRAKLL